MRGVRASAGGEREWICGVGCGCGGEAVGELYDLEAGEGYGETHQRTQVVEHTVGEIGEGGNAEHR